MRILKLAVTAIVLAFGIAIGTQPSMAAKTTCPVFKVTSTAFKVKGTAGAADSGYVTFTVTPAPDGLTYNWSASAGGIIDGQNTKTITVLMADLPSGTTVAANLEVGGLDPSCPSKLSAEVKAL